MKISVLGAGRWGTFIAWYLNRIGNDVTVYGRNTSESFLKLKETRSNEYVTLPESIKFSFDLDESVQSSDVTVISVGAQNLRSLLKSMGEYKKDKVIVLCMKGIECETGKRLTEVAVEEGVDKQKVAVWVGPGHIQEFVREKPNCMVIDSYSEELTRFIADSFRSDLIRFYYGNDVIGSEVGAAAKNVLGIAAGVLDGLGLETLKGALMARGAREVSRLIGAMGGNPLSAYGLCHLGDYETTLFSKFSQNRAFGEAFVKGEKYSKLAEGVMTAKAMKKLGEKYDADLPITKAVCAMMFDSATSADEILKLFSRSPKSEFYS